METIHRLSAILMADAVGYSRLMGEDEQRTVATLAERRGVFLSYIPQFHGRVVDAKGDALLAEFGAVTDALACAVEIQRELAERNEELPEPRRMRFRIGINLGEVLVQGEEVYGDGVSVAARLESLAEPGGICISRAAHDQALGKLPVQYEYLGEQSVKNIDHPIRAYRVLSVPGAAHRPAPRRFGPRALLLAAAGTALGVGKELMKHKAVDLVAAGVAALAIGVTVAFQQVSLSPKAEAPGGQEDPILALPKGPSIAVLPFANLSGNPAEEYFSDGITEEIITELTRFSDLRVIARNSTFQYKGRSLDVRQVGKELGARYVLEGSIRTSGGRIRVTAQLIDATTGAHAWAETYERPLNPKDIFAIQDEIKAKIAGTIGGAWGVIARAGLESAQRNPPTSLDAYQCMLRGMAYYDRIVPEEHLRVRSCLEIAVKDEPGNSDAWGWLGLIYVEEHLYGYNARPDPLGRATAAARRSVELAPGSQFSHSALSVSLYYQRDPTFFEESEQTIVLNPNNASALLPLGMYVAYAGRWERGMALIEKMAPFNPRAPTWISFPFHYSYYLRGEYDRALSYALRIQMPGYFWTHAVKAMDWGQLGKKEEAKSALAELEKLYPNFGAHVRDELKKWFWRERDREHFIEGLRKAGLEIPDEK